MRTQDRADFIEWASARKGALLGTAYLMVGDHHLAEDLVQEALTKTYVAWPRIRDTSKAEAYARRAVTTTAISWWRRKSSHERAYERLPDQVGRDDMADDVTRRDWIWLELQALPINSAPPSSCAFTKTCRSPIPRTHSAARRARSRARSPAVWTGSSKRSATSAN